MCNSKRVTKFTLIRVSQSQKCPYRQSKFKIQTFDWFQKNFYIHENDLIFWFKWHNSVKKSDDWNWMRTWALFSKQMLKSVVYKLLIVKSTTFVQFLEVKYIITRKLPISQFGNGEILPCQFGELNKVCFYETHMLWKVRNQKMNFFIFFSKLGPYLFQIAKPNLKLT